MPSPDRLSSHPRGGKLLCLPLRSLQSVHMESAIDVEHFACREREVALNDGSYSFADILRPPPATDWGQSFGNQPIVFFSYPGCHIGLNDPGSDLKYGYPVLR